MTATDTTEYRKLELDSSNDIIRHDARRSDRKYPEAAWHALQAGHGRRRMGILMRDAGEFTRAAEDWLSAAACFVLATQPVLVATGVEKVRELEQAGHIPPERRDIHTAIQERATELKSLKERLTAFREEYAGRFGTAFAASQERLDFLLQHVREFPGFAALHYAIYQQSRQLDQAKLAAEHLRWAAEFGSEEAEYVGRYGFQLITTGQAERAADIAKWFLNKRPQEQSIRVLLAQALVAQPGDQKANRKAALAVLHEVLSDQNAETGVRLAAIVLSGAIQRDLGEEKEAGRFLALFDQLKTALHTPTEQNRITALRELLTKPLGNGTQPTTEACDLFLAEPIRNELFQEDVELGTLLGSGCV